MDCIIDEVNFYELEAMKYFSPSASMSNEAKKENAINKIFSGQWWGAMKKDGVFTMVGRNPNGEIFLRPRARNVKKEFVNKVNWVPHLHDFLNSLEPGTVLLAELYLPRDEQAKSSSSIMNSLQSKAVKKQEKDEDKLVLYVFDILANTGESYLNMKAIDRFLCIEDYSKKYNAPFVEWAKYYNGKELWDNLQSYLAEGREGVVITYEEATYQPGKRSNRVSLKIKKELQDTIDCVVMGGAEPTKLYSGKEIETWTYWHDTTTGERITAEQFLAKYHTTIYGAYRDGATLEPVTKNWFYRWAGSWIIGAYKGNKLVKIGQLSGLTDEQKENWRDYIGKVVEVSCMEITDNEQGGKGLRHPKLISIRMDVDARECTWERIFDER